MMFVCTFGLDAIKVVFATAKIVARVERLMAARESHVEHMCNRGTGPDLANSQRSEQNGFERS